MDKKPDLVGLVVLLFGLGVLATGVASAIDLGQAGTEQPPSELQRGVYTEDG